MTDIVLDQYRIVRPFAKGGMAELFLAEDTRDNDRQVVVKVLMPEYLKETAFVTQFIDEAKLARNLHHESIIATLGAGVWRDTYVIVMELVDGMDLLGWNKALRAKHLVTPLRVAVRIAHDAALGLHYAHTATDDRGKPLEIIHRDISPQNIMVDVHGRTRVVDFGIAKARNRLTRTVHGMVKGKIAYMPPEQLAADKLTATVDQYALGVVFWELCTGQVLFEGNTMGDTIQRLMTMEVPRPTKLDEFFPQSLETVMLRMLERKPKSRFSSCLEVAESLDDYMNNEAGPISKEEVGKFARQLLDRS